MADDGVIIWENTHENRAAFDFAVQALDRIGRVRLRAVFLGKGHVSQHVMLGLIHEVWQLRNLGPDLVGSRPPLSAGGLGGVLGEGRGDEGRDRPAPALARMGEGVALEVDAAPLPGGASCTPRRPDREDPPATPNLQVGGIDPQIGPIAFQGTVQKRLHLAVDLFAQAADLALADPRHADTAESTLLFGLE